MEPGAVFQYQLFDNHTLRLPDRHGVDRHHFPSLYEIDELLHRGRVTLPRTKPMNGSEESAHRKRHGGESHRSP
jgi:hypothetical protein